MLRFNIDQYLQREQRRIEAKKESQGTFPSTPLDAALWDMWNEYRQESKVASFSDMPKNLQNKFKQVAKEIQKEFPKVDVYAGGSAVNGGYVDEESEDFILQAYQRFKGKKYSDLDVYIDGEYDIEKLKNIKVDIMPIKMGNLIKIT